MTDLTLDEDKLLQSDEETVELTDHALEISLSEMANENTEKLLDKNIEQTTNKTDTKIDETHEVVVNTQDTTTNVTNDTAQDTPQITENERNRPKSPEKQTDTNEPTNPEATDASTDMEAFLTSTDMDSSIVVLTLPEEPTVDYPDDASDSSATEVAECSYNGSQAQPSAASPALEVAPSSVAVEEAESVPDSSVRREGESMDVDDDITAMEVEAEEPPSVDFEVLYEHIQKKQRQTPAKERALNRIVVEATLFANLLKLVTEANKPPTAKTDRYTQTEDRPAMVDQAAQTTPRTTVQATQVPEPSTAPATYKRSRQYSSDSSSGGRPEATVSLKSTPWYEDTEPEQESAAALSLGQNSSNYVSPTIGRSQGPPARLISERRPLQRADTAYTGPMQIRGQNVMVLPKLPGCWNCGNRGHRYPMCQLELQVFCHRCGLRGVYVFECPQCSAGWHNQGPWVPSLQSHVPRDVRLPRQERE